MLMNRTANNELNSNIELETTGWPSLSASERPHTKAKKNGKGVLMHLFEDPIQSRSIEKIDCVRWNGAPNDLLDAS